MNTGPHAPHPRRLPGLGSTTIARAGQAAAGVALVVALTLVWTLSGLGSGTHGSDTTGTAAQQNPSAATVEPTGHTTEANLAVDGMSLTPSDIDVPAGDRLVVTFNNTGDQRHDLTFANGATLASLAPGDQATLDVGIIDSDLEGWCTLPGHKEMGMTVTVHVVGAAASGASPDAASMSGMSGMGEGDSGTSTDEQTGTHVPSAAALEDEAAASEPRPAELPAAEESTEHWVTLTVTEQDEQLADGATRNAWTYNGTSPGPTLHGHIGDTFHVTLVNHGTMSHSIDFHAGQVSPDTAMRSISPGESLEYTFTAERSGIWMYHCSTMPMSLHIANGMFGAVIIDPPDLGPVDQEYVLIQSELYLGANGSSADPAAVAAGAPDIVAFNGRAFQYDAHPLTARAGQRVRIWVLDAGPDLSLAFHVVGTQFDTVWSEGAFRVHNGLSADGATSGTTGAQVLALDAAQGGYVEFVPTETGHYAIVNHRMNLAEKGAHGILDVTP